MRWCVPRSTAVYSGEIYDHHGTVWRVGCAGRARSTQCLVASGAGATGRNRRPYRRITRLGFAAVGLWAAGRRFAQRGFRERTFMRRGTFQPNSQRKTLTVDQYHPLRSLAALGFTDPKVPFFAGAKLPSRRFRPTSANSVHPVRPATPAMR